MCFTVQLPRLTNARPYYHKNDKCVTVQHSSELVVQECGYSKTLTMMFSHSDTHSFELDWLVTYIGCPNVFEGSILNVRTVHCVHSPDIERCRTGWTVTKTQKTGTKILRQRYCCERWREVKCQCSGNNDKLVLVFCVTHSSWGQFVYSKALYCNLCWNLY